MPWNYRVVESRDGYSVRAVYYKDDGLLMIEGYSSEPAVPQGDSLQELVDELSRFIAATEQPVLSEDVLGRGGL